MAVWAAPLETTGDNDSANDTILAFVRGPAVVPDLGMQLFVNIPNPAEKSDPAGYLLIDATANAASELELAASGALGESIYCGDHPQVTQVSEPAERILTEDGHKSVRVSAQVLPLQPGQNSFTCKVRLTHLLLEQLGVRQLSTPVLKLGWIGDPLPSTYCVKLRNYGGTWFRLVESENCNSTRPVSTPGGSPLNERSVPSFVGGWQVPAELARRDVLLFVAGALLALATGFLTSGVHWLFSRSTPTPETVGRASRAPQLRRPRSLRANKGGRLDSGSAHGGNGQGGSSKGRR